MNPDIRSQFEGLAASQFRRADGLWEGIARVSGMDCGACAVEIEQSARKVSGFSEFSVNPASQLVRWVAYTPSVISELLQDVSRLGYAFGLQDEAHSSFHTLKNRHAARSRFLRFLVAALCMMQIMMYSTPEYLFPASDIGVAETGLLRWAQWVLTWPLMLYCARPFFQRAWAGALQGRLLMDQPVSLGLLLAFVLSTLNLNQLNAHVWFDSIAMLLTLLLFAQYLLELQTNKALSHLSSLQPDLPLQVEVPLGGGWRQSPVAALRTGQVYRLQAGYAVPVDSVVHPGQGAVWVDEAMRTGESDPVCKREGELVQAGSRLIATAALLRCQPAPHGDSLLATGQLLLQALSAKPRHQDLVDKVLPRFILAVLLCALCTAIYWAAWRGQLQLAASATVAVLIVTCPCALALALPLVRLFGIRSLADHGVLVRNPQALDVLAKVNVMVFDKTGTLTPREADHVLMQPWPGLSPIRDAWAFQALCELARSSSHPLSRQVARSVLHLQGNADQHIEWLRQNEHSGAGLLGVCLHDGQEYEFRLGSLVHCGLPRMQQAESNTLFASCANRSTPGVLQVLQFEVRFSKPPALNAQLNALRTQGLGLHVLSGDRPGTVKEWGMGLPFDSLEGGMLPEHKVQWIAGRQGRGVCVAMVGDGLNDSGAFAQADVAFAAAGASTLSAGQADLLLLNSGLSGVLASVRVARKMASTGRQNLWWALAYNAVLVPVAMAGWLTPWMASLGMGLSSLLVLGNAMRVKSKAR